MNSKSRLGLAIAVGSILTLGYFLNKGALEDRLQGAETSPAEQVMPYIPDSALDLSKAAPLKGGELVNLRGADYDITVQSQEKVVTIVTSHKSCAPCRSYEAFLKDFVGKHKDISFLVVDNEFDEDIFFRLDREGYAKAIPATIFYRGGKLLDSFQGNAPRWLNKGIKKHYR